MNSKKQGDVGLGAAIAYFTSIGATVCIPLTDSQDYDLIADIEGILNKVQVKHCTYKPRKNYCVGLSVKGGNRTGRQRIKYFDNTKVDLLFICTEENSYCIPAKFLTIKNAITLGEKYDQFKISR